MLWPKDKIQHLPLITKNFLIITITEAGENKVLCSPQAFLQPDGLAAVIYGGFFCFFFRFIFFPQRSEHFPRRIQG